MELLLPRQEAVAVVEAANELLTSTANQITEIERQLAELAMATDGAAEGPVDTEHAMQSPKPGIEAAVEPEPEPEPESDLELEPEASAGVT